MKWFYFPQSFFFLSRGQVANYFNLCYFCFIHMTMEKAFTFISFID